MIELRTVNLTRYITPLREGGSLPALAEADDDFKYVVKFRGAGHGTRALVAELIGGEIARLLGFRVPELVFLNLDEALAVPKAMKKYKTCCKEAEDSTWDCISSRAPSPLTRQPHASTPSKPHASSGWTAT